MEYVYKICKWDSELGVPFQTHMYAPEKHPMTQKDFHEREDEGHVFKVSFYYTNSNIIACLQHPYCSQRIGHHTRNGGPLTFKLERIVEAVQHAETNLIYTALTGQRKQLDERMPWHKQQYDFSTLEINR